MLLAAKQKHNIYKRAIKDSKAGIITVFDRYPYEFFNKMAEPMDGPKISSLMKSQGMLRTIFSRLEREIYKKIKKPNLTIVLDTDPEVSHIRKPDHSLKILKEKYLAIQTFKSRNKCEVVDTDRKLEEVLEITKKKVWNVI